MKERWQILRVFLNMNSIKQTVEGRTKEKLTGFDSKRHVNVGTIFAFLHLVLDVDRAI